MLAVGNGCGFTSASETGGQTAGVHCSTRPPGYLSVLPAGREVAAVGLAGRTVGCGQSPYDTPGSSAGTLPAPGMLRPRGRSGSGRQRGGRRAPAATYRPRRGAGEGAGERGEGGRERVPRRAALASLLPSAGRSGLAVLTRSHG